MLKLYLLSQDVNNDYDIFDKIVVAAESEDEARMIHPDTYRENPWNKDEVFATWAFKPEQVKVKQIGVASSSVQKGEVLIASYNAG